MVPLSKLLGGARYLALTSGFQIKYWHDKTFNVVPDTGGRSVTLPDPVTPLRTGVMFFLNNEGGSSFEVRKLVVTSPYFDDTLAQANLRGFWTLDETSGNAVDYSSSGANGTVTGGTRGVARLVSCDITGKAFLSAGASGYVTIAHNAALNITGDITIEAWIKTTTASASIFLSFGNHGAPYEGYALSYGPSGTGNKLAYYNGNGSTWYGGTGPDINDGARHHVVAVGTSTTQKLYVDGVLVKTTNVNGQPSSWVGERAIGYAAEGGNPFIGTLDNVAVYARAFTGSEVAARHTLGISDPPGSITVAPGETGVAVLVKTCQGTRDWRMAKRTAGVGTLIVQTTPTRPTACIDSIFPPDPPPPDTLCPIQAKGTGQDATGGVDNAWSVNGNPAVRTAINPDWPAETKADPAARWIAEDLDTSSGFNMVFDKTFVTNVLHTGDPTAVPLRGSFCVDNKLLDIKVNDVSTKIKYDQDQYGWRDTHEFEIDYAMGLKSGYNKIEFITRQTHQDEEPNYYGLWVKWQGQCIEDVITNCVIVAQNTGYGPLDESDDCDHDNNWFIGSDHAHITTRIDGWVRPPDGCKWIAGLCDTSDVGESGGLAYHEFTTNVDVLSDDVLSIKGSFSADDELADIIVNGTSSGINQTNAFAHMFAFELTRAMGVITGANTLVFKTRQSSEGGPWGLLVQFDGACAKPPSTAGCDIGALATCPLTKTVTVSGGTGDWAVFNGVYTASRDVTQNYWRWTMGTMTIDLQCQGTQIAGASQYKWQVFLNGGVGLKRRFGATDHTSVCPPNATYVCAPSPSEGGICDGTVSVVVAD